MSEFLMILYLFHLINISTIRVLFQFLQKVMYDIDDIHITIEELCQAASDYSQQLPQNLPLLSTCLPIEERQRF